MIPTITHRICLNFFGHGLSILFFKANLIPPLFSEILQTWMKFLEQFIYYTEIKFPSAFRKVNAYGVTAYFEA